MPLQTPHLDQEARRWQAVFAALRAKNDLSVTVEPDLDKDRVFVQLAQRQITPESVALWDGIKERNGSVLYMHCSTSEWREMLADAVKGASC